MPPQQGAVEQTLRRTKNAKHYLNPDGTYSAVISNGPIHYQATQNGSWLDKKQQFAAGAGTNEWISSESDVTMRTYQVGQGGNATWWIQFTDTLSGQGVEFQVLGRPSTTAGSNTLSFTDGSARTWTYTHTRSGGKMWGPAMQNTEPATTYTFNYHLLGGAPALTTTPEGDLVCGSIFRMPRSYMRGADGNDYPASAWTIGTGTVSFTMDHLAAGLPLAAYPFQLDPSTTFNVAASADDANAYRQGSTVFPPNTANSYLDNYLEVYAEKDMFSATDFRIWNPIMRWDTSTLSGDTVSGTTLRIVTSDTGQANTDSKTMSGGYYTWTGTASDYLATAETSAFSGFNYTAAGTVGTTSDITLSSAAANINTSGYTALRLHLSDGGTPTGRNYFSIATYDHTTLNEPRLLVDYTVPPDPTVTDTGIRTYANVLAS